MPLSAPAPRESLHTRQIECRGFRRKDGLWDIEAHLTDVKSYEIESDWRGNLAPGKPVHDMWVRLTLDGDLRIHAIETASDATPYELCPNVVENYQALVGLRVAPGWNRQVRSRVGGVNGCTHITELMNVLATVAFQTIFSLREKDLMAAGDRKPPMLDSCHAWDSSGPVVKAQYPAWYAGD
ncbi:MAG: DUF2889 domain-containing protein [Alphaproteobacteria bacterium]